MKISIKILALLALLSTVLGCSDFLDRYPSTAIEKDDAIVSYASAEAALVGTYSSMQNATWYNGSRYIVFGDVLADFMQPTNPEMRSGRMYQMNYTATTAPAFWSGPYNVIRNANNIITAIDNGKVTGASDDAIADIRGQALAMRALAHFDLCRVYGKPYMLDNGAAANGGVPIVLTQLDYNAEMGRNTVAEVYTQVIKDLTDAAGADAKSKLKSDKKLGKINSWVAKALLSRVYLYRGGNDDLTKALSLAEEVMSSSLYGLWNSAEYGAWAAMGSKEFLFELVSTPTDNMGAESLRNMLREEGLNDYVLTKAFIDEMNLRPNDVRWNYMTAATKADNIAIYGASKVYLDKKYPTRDAASNTHNIYIVRMSEVYLNAAEAAFKLGNIAKAKQYLNDIYLRADATATPLADVDITLDRILLERGIELVGEGHRFFDLMRNGKEVVRYASEATKGWHLLLIPESQRFTNTYFRSILPIPESELNTNRVIREQQNPGYEM